MSQRLLARRPGTDGKDVVKPATTLNLLAAAWIQFQTHDWFNHGTPRLADDAPFRIPLEADDNWPGGNPMVVRRMRRDPTRDPNHQDDNKYPTTYANAETHWWDGSEVYGGSLKAAMQLRAGVDGKLQIDPQTRLLAVNRAGLEVTGLTANWWLGLSLLHNLFALEHNVICGQLKLAHPDWDDDQLYRTARLVNTALMAKIHTVDWTPAILAHPALRIAMDANWWGLATERVKRLLGRISTSDAVSGIPGADTNHHGADYCLTEEFVAVYRMHPLLPDDIEVRSACRRRPSARAALQSQRSRRPRRRGWA